MPRNKPGRKSPPQSKRPRHHASRGGGTVRIIGGQWRGRKLPILDAEGLRPTPDRVRETLFNWLQGRIQGARCLDLFAGSGALGLEALSRGAGDVVFIEKNAAAARQIRQNLALLQNDNPNDRRNVATVFKTDARDFLLEQASNDSLSQKQFELIFLDPPFRKGWLHEMLGLIKEHELLLANGLIYLERENESGLEDDFSEFGLAVLKSTQAGQVISQLLEKIEATRLT